MPETTTKNAAVAAHPFVWAVAFGLLSARREDGPDAGRLNRRLREAIDARVDTSIQASPYGRSRGPKAVLTSALRAVVGMVGGRADALAEALAPSSIAAMAVLDDPRFATEQAAQRDDRVKIVMPVDDARALRTRIEKGWRPGGDAGPQGHQADAMLDLDDALSEAIRAAEAAQSAA